MARRRAHRPVTLPEDQRELREQAYQEWTKSARKRGDYRPPRPDPFCYTELEHPPTERASNVQT